MPTSFSDFKVWHGAKFVGTLCVMSHLPAWRRLQLSASTSPITHQYHNNIFSFLCLRGPNPFWHVIWYVSLHSECSGTGIVTVLWGSEMRMKTRDDIFPIFTNDKSSFLFLSGEPERLLLVSTVGWSGKDLKISGLILWNKGDVGSLENIYSR